MLRLLLLTLVTVSSIARADTDCSPVAMNPAVHQYRVDFPGSTNAGAAVTYKTVIDASGLTAYAVPMHQKFDDGQLGCGIGVAYVVLVDDSCKVHGVPAQE